MAGASALASAAPVTQADVTYLHLLDQNGVSYPNPEAMVSYAHDLVDQLSAAPQNDASVGSIVNTGEERISQHDMGVIIAAAVVAYRPSLIPVVRHWADSAAVVPQRRGCCDEETDDSCVGGLPQHCCGWRAGWCCELSAVSAFTCFWQHGTGATTQSPQSPRLTAGRGLPPAYRAAIRRGGRFVGDGLLGIRWSGLVVRWT